MTLAAICALGSTAVLAADAKDLKWSVDASNQCTFVAPASLGEGAKQWIGSCSNLDHKATGIGMIIARNGAKSGPAFYGELRAGVPIIGVVDLPDGYQAGLFSGRDIGDAKESEWTDINDSFDVAVRVAKRVSEHYKQEKNAASAKHYAEVAKRLDAQRPGD